MVSALLSREELDVEDLEYTDFIRARRKLQPGAALIAFEDYIVERVFTIWRLVGERPMSLNGIAFPICTNMYGNEATIILTYKHIKSTTISLNFSYEYDIVDAVVFDYSGVIYEACDAHPISARLTVTQTILEESSRR